MPVAFLYDNSKHIGKETEWEGISSTIPSKNVLISEKNKPVKEWNGSTIKTLDTAEKEIKLFLTFVNYMEVETKL